MASDEKKTILLTGGNSGIGLAACKHLCRLGHKVIATVRSKDKGEYCLSEVKKAHPFADIDYVLCDVSNPTSVKEMVTQVKERWLSDGQLLDVLVNNAGCSPGFSEPRTTCDHQPDWEISVATNCLGPVLITDLLLEDLKKTASKKGEARVVMVNTTVILSDTYSKYKTGVDDLMMEKPGVYESGMLAPHKNSKVALMLATQAIVDELEGTNVKVTSICPSVTPALCKRPQSPYKGGTYILDAAVGKTGALSTGKMYIRNKRVDLPPQCLNKENQKKLLKKARELTQSPLA